MISLQDEIRDLSVHLKQLSHERNCFEQNMNRMQIEKLRLEKERDDQMDSLSSRLADKQLLLD
jgi:hypothetical protein